ncbi:MULTISPECIES: ribonuclease P protein component [unclassified Thioalkalivibrio]|uniref:ribonuclease P protein component n=1 Tax=unclassified Thioalkalivibrio TaxID=2621013 RepID=UPI00036696AC|nr:MULTISPECIES: ribonuclease P protein component [unclassified Thioalkalivibrio]
MTAAPAIQTFPRRVRLLTGADYQRVFEDARRQRGRDLTLLYRRSETGEARLGLAIGKRHVRHATDRNRIKRIVREAFRVRRAQLPPLDMIVLARGGAASAERRALRAEIDSLLERLQ